MELILSETPVTVSTLKQDLEQSGTHKFSMEQVNVKIEPVSHEEDSSDTLQMVSLYGKQGENGLHTEHVIKEDPDRDERKMKDIKEITIKCEPLIKEEPTSDQECSEPMDDTQVCTPPSSRPSLFPVSLKKEVKDPLQESQESEQKRQVVTSGLGTDVCVSGNSDCIKTVDINKIKCTNNGTYKCDVCSKQYNRKDSLLVHLRTHTGYRPYKCNICNKNFNQSSILNAHMRTHTGDRPYKCDICNKSFGRLGHLNEHTRTHTGDKPYNCKICNKAFNHIGNLNAHTRIHTGVKPYTCKICDRSFNHLSAHNDHTRTHTGDKPYKCKICNRAFSKSGNLNYHVRAHSGAKPYKCDSCEKAFKCASTLKSHILAHNLEKEGSVT